MAERNRLFFAAALAAWLSAVAPSTASAAMSEPQIRAAVTKAYGVRVLKIRRGEAGGKAVFLVTVMNAGGAFNEAFRVTVLAVDAQTGKLVPGFRHRASGLQENQGPSYRTGRQSADSFRQGFSWR